MSIIAIDSQILGLNKNPDACTHNCRKANARIAEKVRRIIQETSGSCYLHALMLSSTV
jgi:hypothetical protein